MSDNSPIRWHQLFGHLLDLLLTPLGVEVEVEVSVMSDPPRTDILLIRRLTPRWTPEQMRYLPNGLRESTAAHNLIEFKMTESVSAQTVTKLAADWLHYQESRNLPSNEVAAFIISAKQPRRQRLASWGFVLDESRPGVYLATHPLAHNLSLISLNELGEQDNNAFVQLFASQQKAKRQAQALLKAGTLQATPLNVRWFTSGLLEYFQGEIIMTTTTEELTPELLTERGKEWARILIQSLPPEERLAGLTLSEIEAYLAKKRQLKDKEQEPAEDV